MLVEEKSPLSSMLSSSAACLPSPWLPPPYWGSSPPLSQALAGVPTLTIPHHHHNMLALVGAAVCPAPSGGLSLSLSI